MTFEQITYERHYFVTSNDFDPDRGPSIQMNVATVDEVIEAVAAALTAKPTRGLSISSKDWPT